MDILQSITPSERKLLHSSFQVLRSDVARHGTTLYIRLFEHYPEYKALFPRLRHISDEFLMSTGQLRNLGVSYMKGMSKIIDVLDNAERLSRAVKVIAKAHKEHNISKTHVLHMCPVLVELLRRTGATVDSKCEAAWIKLFGAIAELIEEYKN